MIKTFRLKSIFIVLGIILFVTQASAQNLYKTNQYEIGISVGALLSGTVDISKTGESQTLTSKTEFMGRFFFDIVLGRRSSVGVFVNASELAFEGDSVSVSLRDFGIMYKYRFLLNKRMGIRPGIGIGYRILNSATPIVNSGGLSANLSLEFVYALTKDNIKLFLDTGILTQPFGRADEWDVRFGPIPYFNVGVAF